MKSKLDLLSSVAEQRATAVSVAQSASQEEEEPTSSSSNLSQPRRIAQKRPRSSNPIPEKAVYKESDSKVPNLSSTPNVPKPNTTSRSTGTNTYDPFTFNLPPPRSNRHTTAKALQTPHGYVFRTQRYHDIVKMSRFERKCCFICLSKITTKCLTCGVYLCIRIKEDDDENEEKDEEGGEGGANEHEADSNEEEIDETLPASIEKENAKDKETEKDEGKEGGKETIEKEEHVTCAYKFHTQPFFTYKVHTK
jgi:hypothetical protein